MRKYELSVNTFFIKVLLYSLWVFVLLCHLVKIDFLNLSFKNKWLLIDYIKRLEIVKCCRHWERVKSWQTGRETKRDSADPHEAALCGDRKITATIRVYSSVASPADMNKDPQQTSIPPSCHPSTQPEELPLRAPIQQLPLLAGLVWKRNGNCPQMPL